MSRARGVRIVVSLSALGWSVAGSVRAQAQSNWRVTFLGPTGYVDSSGNAGWGSRQGGWNQFPGGERRPVLWDGTAGSMVDLTPPGDWIGGTVQGMDGTHEVGAAANGAGKYRAALWSGTAGSFVNLNPAGTTYSGSTARAVRGNMQAGGAQFAATATSHAAMWRGTSASFVDLHPAGAISSNAYATDGLRQGGYYDPPGAESWRACIWNGASADRVDLNPAGSTESIVQGMAAGVQAGYATFPLFRAPHAALWRGTAESFVDLNPSRAAASSIYATDGRYHVGAANFTNVPTALIWLGDTGDHYFNLHALLPPGYFTSTATSVSVSGDTVFITGNVLGAFLPSGAVVWTATIPCPGSVWVVLLTLPARARRGRRSIATGGPSR